jgi:DNA-binding Lrp family transcriptional regulator
MSELVIFDAVDKQIVNRLQHGLPITERPYQVVAAELDLDEDDLIARIESLLERKILSRFGPMYDAARMSGHVTLAAIVVPANRFKEITELVNSFPEVAHNYARDHRLNMWFVIATDKAVRAYEVITEISNRSGLDVYDFPKQKEFFLDLKLEA